MRPITAEEEFAKNPDLKRADVEQLKQWMATQPHLPRGVPDEQLILFLHCSHSHLEDCKKVVEAYYTLRTQYPELFANRNPKGDEVHQAFNNCDFYQLPRKDQQENQIMGVRMKDVDVSSFSHAGVMKTYIMVQDAYMVEAGTVPGYVFLLDLKECKIGHLTKMKASFCKVHTFYYQDAFPGNVQEIHIFNVNFAAMGILQLLRPFLKKELNRKIFIHSSVDSLRRHVSSDSLPMDYGGSLASIETYQKLAVEQLERCSDWFGKEEAFRVDESKRPGKGNKTKKVPSNEDSITILGFD